MNKEDTKYLLACIDMEGFDYAFVDYSNYSRIKDEELHRLHNQFLQARRLLAAYVADQAEQHQLNIDHLDFE